MKQPTYYQNFTDPIDPLVLDPFLACQLLKRKDKKLEKIINRNTVKISYSGTPNMARIISSQNRKVLQEKRKKEKPDQKECKARKE